MTHKALYRMMLFRIYLWRRELLTNNNLDLMIDWLLAFLGDFFFFKVPPFPRILLLLFFVLYRVLYRRNRFELMTF